MTITLKLNAIIHVDLISHYKMNNVFKNVGFGG
jgi:hypothetical protein